ncbi:hypothetical protein R3P38DRAFT_3060732 [Favolaschia claudopus]|uniref:Uncharacterized protein n=1 Tax=Favolaschia claudopus TaxID=2862362 RepID=A0AAW0A1L9_9AGAR
MRLVPFIKGVMGLSILHYRYNFWISRRKQSEMRDRIGCLRHFSNPCAPLREAHAYDDPTPAGQVRGGDNVMGRVDMFQVVLLVSNGIEQWEVVLTISQKVPQRPVRGRHLDRKSMVPRWAWTQIIYGSERRWKTSHGLTCGRRTSQGSSLVTRTVGRQLRGQWRRIRYRECRKRQRRGDTKDDLEPRGGLHGKVNKLKMGQLGAHDEAKSR